jgi:Ser/Thr protein kinase RdoA (MazF antagonist)
MNITNITPNEQVAAAVVTSMTGEQVLSASRMTTGDQNFVYAVKTEDSEYVIRMTDVSRKDKFLAAIYWQHKFIPLGIPLAEFIKSDLDAKYSPYPSLLMMRLQGDDLINIHPNLTDVDKKNLATEMVEIQAKAIILPEGPALGITDSYEHVPEDKSWYDFLINRLQLFLTHITEARIFDPTQVKQAISLAKNMKENFRLIRPTPFLWDASERNVIVYDGKITGIVDVDDVCFGDPLLVVGLTSTCIELEGFDTHYTDYWAEALNLDQQAQHRLDFYRLFYTVAFMRKHSTQSNNSKMIMFDTEKLNYMFQQALERMIQSRC